MFDCVAVMFGGGGVFGFDEDAEFFLGPGIADEQASVLAEGLFGFGHGAGDFGN